MNRKKVLLIIRDGWGYTKRKKDNAILEADTNFINNLEKKYSTIFLEASGKAVGIPDGLAGNSEVGHMTIGAGRAFEQSLLKINKKIKNQEFLINPEILKAIQNVKKNNSKLHLISLLQEAGVHSHINHLFATLDYAKKEGLKQDQIILHIITDGRDSHPKSGINFLIQVAEQKELKKIGWIATIIGRYYAMDRNKNWDRTELAFKAISEGKGKEFECGIDELNYSYKNNITDEFIKPLVKRGYSGVKNNDSVFFLNFRKDRAIQLSQSFVEKSFQEFPRIQKKVFFLAMTQYNEELKLNNVFNDINVENTVTEILDKNNLKQLRISETEKFAHVTFFFDGGSDFNSKNIEKILIPSPKVVTYDLQPEMSIKKITSTMLEKINTEKYDFILLNYPNPDMVGHTGNFNATVRACEFIDKSLEKIIPEALKKKYTILLTADHGNAEKVSRTFTSHTKNKVPFTFISNEKIILKKGEFSIANIGATILKIFNLEIPKEMDESLF